MDRIWILGSMGWMPARSRQTTSILCEVADELILLDAGTGVANLADHADVLARHTRLTVVLTHYHLDHTAGLMYLKRFAADKHVSIHGPGRPAFPHSTQHYVGDLLQQAAYSSGPFGFARSVSYHDYGGHDFFVGDLRVEVASQTHSSPSFRLRLGDALVLATDTTLDEAALVAERHATVLLHECWQRTQVDPRHSSAEALVRVLPRTSFDRCVWMHLNPAWDDGELRDVETLAASCGSQLAFDGMCIEL